MQYFRYLWDCFDMGIIDHNILRNNHYKYNESLGNMAQLATQNVKILDAYNFNMHILDYGIMNGNQNRDPFMLDRINTTQCFFTLKEICNMGLTKYIPVPKFAPKAFTHNSRSVRIMDDLHIPEAILVTTSLGNLCFDTLTHLWLLC